MPPDTVPPASSATDDAAVRKEAFAAFAAGLCVLPPRENGSKAPLGEPLFAPDGQPLVDETNGRQRWGWERYKAERASEAELGSWYDDLTKTGLGIVCGAVSGSIESPEWEDADAFAAYQERAQQAGLADLIARVLHGYLDETPGGGFRTFIRCEEITGNLKLASRPCPGPPLCLKHLPGKPHVLIETRGEGGYAITAPSYGKVHSSRRPYVRLAGGFDLIATVTSEERAQLYALASSMDEMPREQHGTRRASGSSSAPGSAGERPGDRFNREADWLDILEPHGWRLAGRNGEELYHTRPGKDSGVSATLNYAGCDLLYVFTTSTEFDADRSYDKFSAYAFLEHGGDFRAAARALHKRERQSGSVKAPADTQQTTSSPTEVVSYAPGTHHLTDLGNAKRFVARHGNDLRYVPGLAKWHYWAGTHWGADETGEAERRAKETALSIYDEARALYDEAAAIAQSEEPTSLTATEDDPTAKRAGRLKTQGDRLWDWARKSEARDRLRAVLDLARTEPVMPVKVAELDADPWAFNCRNGTLDLRSGELRPHRREDLLTMLAPVEFHREARHPLFDEFLAGAIPDEATRFYVQRAVGASLAVVQRDDKVFLLMGPGGTGKTTLMEAVRACMGGYGAMSSLETFTRAKYSRGAADPDLARLRGKRAVFIPEAGKGGSVVEVLKSATGGDTIVARHLYAEPIEFEPVFTLWLRSNTRPRLPDDDDGLRRRLVELPFRQRFPLLRPEIRDTLKNDLDARAAVLAWVVKGCIEWQQNGLSGVPEAVAQATEELWVELDPLGDFIAECCVLGPQFRAGGRQLYEDYTRWAGEQGLSKNEVMTGTRFGRLMGSRYRKEKGRNGVSYHGIGLASEHENGSVEPRFSAACDGFGATNDPGSAPASHPTGPDGDGLTAGPQIRVTGLGGDFKSSEQPLPRVRDFWEKPSQPVTLDQPITAGDACSLCGSRNAGGDLCQECEAEATR